jgi:uncharacterized protein (DUF362 family)
VAIRASFMLGYDRRDRSNVNDVEMVDLVARYLRRRGVRDVAVLEAPTVYENYYAHRSVAEVASYFGFDSLQYRVVDISQDLRPFTYERGFVQHAISATWMDADLRIVMPKLRTAPTDFAHLSLCALEGTTGRIDDTVYIGRSVDYRSATMMLLDVAPPDFAVIDGWTPVAQGPFGVMGCHQPSGVRLVYAGSDALSVDEVVLGDLGIDDARRAPIVRMAHHWFGLAPALIEVDGRRPRLQRDLRGAHASRSVRLLGMASHPIYVYLSNGGPGLCAQVRLRLIPSVAPSRTGASDHPVGEPACLRNPSAGHRIRAAMTNRALDWRAAWDGLSGTVLQGRPSARALAILDSRHLVRTLFLSSAVRSGIITHLRSGRSVAELARLTGSRRPDRLRAWLQVGVDVGELRKRGDRYRVSGHRACALAAGDTLLVAHYRSILEYQVGPYAELGRHDPRTRQRTG